MSALLLAGLLLVPIVLGRSSRRRDTVGRDLRADSPLPGVMPVQFPQPPNERRALAARVVVELMSSIHGAEDKDLVRAFQAQEGLKASGYYGPSTALALAEKHDYVPPVPRYWTKTGASRARRNLAQRYLQIAASDPQRAEEWRAAAALLA